MANEDLIYRLTTAVYNRLGGALTSKLSNNW